MKLPFNGIAEFLCYRRITALRISVLFVVSDKEVVFSDLKIIVFLLFSSLSKLALVSIADGARI